MKGREKRKQNRGDRGRNRRAKIGEPLAMLRCCPLSFLSPTLVSGVNVS